MTRLRSGNRKPFAVRLSSSIVSARFISQLNPIRKRVPQKTHHSVAYDGTEGKFTHGVVSARQPFLIVGNSVPVEFVESLLGELRQERGIEPAGQHEQSSL